MAAKRPNRSAIKIIVPQNMRIVNVNADKKTKRKQNVDNGRKKW